jgi:hypothetical protein
MSRGQVKLIRRKGVILANYFVSIEFELMLFQKKKY